LKKALLAATGLVALGMAPAFAADLPARTYTKAPPIAAPIYDWSGFYIGINGGGASSRECYMITSSAAITDLAGRGHPQQLQQLLSRRQHLRRRRRAVQSGERYPMGRRCRNRH
jgi:opacity protein-like surface antigen